MGHHVTLENLIAAELEEVQRLLALLSQEQDALIDRQFDRVSQLIDAKSAALQQLELASTQRAQYCAAQALQSVDAIEAALGPAVQIWFDLLQNAKLAETMNRTNGQLIKTHEEVNQYLMSTLAAQRNPNVGYSADGKLSQLTSISRPFDRA
ncbi:flagellar protein FlgN [Chitinibacter fontanus]|uniref:Flagellar protein FlgN n=1 Tax=Chitinibacter fontanus TaxID=1737446 RepID=A0A7D5V918_9NEIS|nr:flagellar protein FlgN [Chitinibacter fontanus]QLI80413.1 flagellar protein FlgN [Chitinibacter fontanus]